MDEIKVSDKNREHHIMFSATNIRIIDWAYGESIRFLKLFKDMKEFDRELSDFHKWEWETRYGRKV